MRCLLLFVLLLSFVSYEATVAASTVPDRFRGNCQWKKQSATMRDDQIIELTLGLQISNPDELETIFNEVSNPLSPRYSQHLSSEEVSMEHNRIS